jgi:hypothetical protein
MSGACITWSAANETAAPKTMLLIVATMLAIVVSPPTMGPNLSAGIPLSMP